MSKSENLENKKLLTRIAKKIKKRRQELKLSQEKLALLAGVHRTYIGTIEKAEQNLTIGVLKNICDVLGLSLSEFFFEFVDKKPIKGTVTKRINIDF